MGKKLVIVIFILCFGLALSVYLSREKKSLRDNLSNKGQREPRLVFEDFTFYRYLGDSLTGRLSARLGHFYEPNVVEFDGEIKGERLTKDGRQTVSAESATAYFKAATLTKLMAETDLERAELTGFVEVGLREHTLSTDYAEYLAADNLVRSLRPVRVQGPNRLFTGDEGFTYGLEDETLQMYGTVKGQFLLNPLPVGAAK